MLQHPGKTYKRVREIDGGAFQQFRVNQLWKKRNFPCCGCAGLGNQAREDCVERVEILGSWLGQLAGSHIAQHVFSSR